MIVFFCLVLSNYNLTQASIKIIKIIKIITHIIIAYYAQLLRITCNCCVLCTIIAYYTQSVRITHTARISCIYDAQNSQLHVKFSTTCNFAILREHLHCRRKKEDTALVLLYCLFVCWFLDSFIYLTRL